MDRVDSENTYFPLLVRPNTDMFIILAALIGGKRNTGLIKEYLRNERLREMLVAATSGGYQMVCGENPSAWFEVLDENGCLKLRSGSKIVCLDLWNARIFNNLPLVCLDKGTICLNIYVYQDGVRFIYDQPVVIDNGQINFAIEGFVDDRMPAWFVWRFKGDDTVGLGHQPTLVVRIELAASQKNEGLCQVVFRVEGNILFENWPKLIAEFWHNLSAGKVSTPQGSYSIGFCRDVDPNRVKRLLSFYKLLSEDVRFFTPIVWQTALKIRADLNFLKHRYVSIVQERINGGD
jgi:hypothetical protein